MVLYPNFKQFVRMLVYQFPYLFQVCSTEPIIFPKFYRHQEYDNMHTLLRHMYMRRLVIVWINCNIVTMSLPIEYFHHPEHLATIAIY